ncbi:MAG: aspartyl protease family protein [Nitrospinae bacterium]|nr:aspartyl protease family protein [Nitrospinota bacterium]MBF0634803.1 aspartyl protease family protein [Nitrospinota bacterium]
MEVRDITSDGSHARLERIWPDEAGIVTARIMRLFAVSTFALVFQLSMESNAQSFYKWVDDDGEIHYSDTSAGVPAKYRNQVKEGQFAKRPPQSSESRSNSPQPAEAVSSKDAERKLKKYEIPYIAYEGSARRIIIPVRFNNSVTVNMALDTGAPGLVISTQLAERLGLFEKDAGLLLTQAGGIGGSTPAMRTVIETIQVGDAKDTFIPATITAKLTAAFEGLVGMDFMSNFSVTIDTQGRKLVLEELQSSSARPGGHDEDWWRINFHDFAAARADWRRFADIMAEQERNRTLPGVSSSQIKQWKAVAEKQYIEADKLFTRLDRHAANNSVPMNWRKY